MGGKAAEYISVGAIQDLKQANNLAERMIGNYGMGDLLEPFYNKNTDAMLAPSGSSYSEKTKESIDEESMRLVKDALVVAKQIILENQNDIDLLVNQLIKKKTLYQIDFVGNPPTFEDDLPSSENFDEILDKSDCERDCQL